MLVLSDAALKVLAIAGTTLTYATIAAWRTRRRGRGYIRLWETNRFPSQGWLKEHIGFFRGWGIDGFAHVSFGFMASISTALFSLYFLGMSLQQYGGLSAFNIVQDLLFWGKVETTWTNLCHRRLGARRMVVSC